MPRERLSGADRRASILAAAQTIFARDGFDRAKTQQIAKSARVSEALVFRHFPTKTAIYRAVLRKLITDQDASIATYGTFDESAAGIVDMIAATFRVAMRGSAAPNAEGVRILFGSLVGDSDYARLTYRRARRITLPRLARALTAARAAGEMEGPGIDAENAYAFIEHISSMMMVLRMPVKPSFDYSGDDTSLLRQAVWFCGRGIGLKDAVIAASFEAGESPAAAEPKQARPSGRRSARPKKAAA